MENHLNHQPMPEISLSSDNSKYKRTIPPEKVVLDLKHALDPVLVRLGRSPARYTITVGGEAVVDVETRMGMNRFSSDNRASTIEVKKWMAVSKALELILREEGMEVRDHSHQELVWTRHAIQSHDKSMVSFKEESAYLEKRIRDLTRDNERMREHIRQLDEN